MNPKFRHIIRLILASLCILFGSFAVVAQQKVEIRVQPTSRNGKIEVGEKFYILVTLHNIDQEPQRITSAGGAEVLYWTQQSSSTSITSVNGRMSQKMEVTYAATMLARKKGSYSIGPITVGGVKSNVAKYTIVDAGSSPDPTASSAHSASQDSYDSDPGAGPTADPSQGGGPTFIGKGNEQLFMRASVSRTTAYEQEALVYTVKLYTTYGSIKFIGATEAPKFEGFVIEESNDISKELTFEQYQGKTYATAIIARYIIFPQMSGKLKVIGNKYTVSTDAQEYYHDPYFSTLTVRRPIQLNVTPNDLEINVKALPTPRPANFSGGVGQFTLTSSLKSDKVAANQAGAVTYTVSGSGNLKYIHLPDLNAIYPDAIEVFSPTTDVQTTVGSSNVSGAVKFDYSFMPLEQGTFNIPPVELVYFNPQTGKYETVSAKGYRLEVAQGEESSKSQATLTFNSRLMPVDVEATPYLRPAIRGFLYWLWFIIPTLILIGVAFARRKYIADRSDIVGMRSRRAGKMARKRLKKAAAAMKAKNEDLFYTEILKAVWGYLSDKLRLPTSELTRDNVSQLLESNGISQQQIDSLVKLLDDCEFAKYSPASLRQPMSAVYDQATDMLNNLEASFTSAPTDKSNSDENIHSGSDGAGNNSQSTSLNTPGSGESSAASTTSNIVKSLLIVLLAGSGVMANAQSPAFSIAEADSAYMKGEYSKTIQLYSQEIEKQGPTAPLLFNLGCAYYKSGNEGEARLCLERAKRLDPSNSQINQNIQYIENRVEDANKAELKGKKGDVMPDNIGFFGRVGKKISVDTSSDTWASFAVMAFILLILAVAVYLFSRNVQIKKLGFFSGLILLGFTVIFIVFAEMAASHFLSKDEAVITAFKVTMTSDPHDANATIGAPLCRGTKLHILESQLNADGKIGWYKVKLNHSNVGWVDASDITVI